MDGLQVYRGRLATGEMVAVKRSSAASLQGAAEFKNEIELLSRVHHRNLVGLVGFCFEDGEQMLVYKYMPNGTLREALAGTLICFTSLPIAAAAIFMHQISSKLSIFSSVF
jgi:serine/threonine protein kinase